MLHPIYKCHSAYNNCAIRYLCHLNTLHQRPASDFILYKGTAIAGINLSARPLTWGSYNRYTLLRKPTLLLGNGDTNCINHAQIRYVWEIKYSPSGAMRPRVSCFIAHTYLLGMIYVIYTYVTLLITQLIYRYE